MGQGGVRAYVCARCDMHRRHGRGTERELLCVYRSGECTNVSRGGRRAGLERWAELQRHGVGWPCWSGVNGMDTVWQRAFGRVALIREGSIGL